MDADGDEVIGMVEAQDGRLWDPERPREGVQPPQSEHPPSAVMWEI